MISLIGLVTVAELAVALVGFAAIASVFRAGAIEDWHPRAQPALWLIVSYGIGTLFFALLLSMLHDF